MEWIRTTAAALLLLTFLPGRSGTASAAAAPSPSSFLSGVVRDDVGKALGGVEVLVLAPEGRGHDALLHAVSDVGGRFLVGAITPGVYRIAAVKSGYVAAISRVNTVLRSSVDLVLRPIPRGGQPGEDTVLPDLSWTLRVPPRSILRDQRADVLVASRATGGARAFAERVQESVRGEVDHVFALGSWHAGTSGPASSVAGNETRMRFAGALGQRGAIHLRGRRGTLDTSSARSTAALSRGAADVDLDVSYETGADESLAMRAFYSSGALQVNGPVGSPSSGVRQSQRSFGYDATWRRQVDASSRVALQVGFQGSNLAMGQAQDAAWDAAAGDALNRGIGAQGSYENLVGDSHLVRLGVRARRLSLEAPAVRVGQDSGGIVLGGGAGWNLLIDTEDQWSVAGPFSMSYGLALRQGSDGTQPTALSPRVGASFGVGRAEAHLAVSYLEESHVGMGTSASAAPDRRSPFGYDLGLRARLDAATTLSGTASYVPSRADDWNGPGVVGEFQSLYVGDGFSSDRFVALELERVAPSATVTFRVARGLAVGVLAPALDETPVVLLSDRQLDYAAARISVNAPRAGSAISLGYRSTKERTDVEGEAGEGARRMLDMEFAQDLVRFASGRASCRLLVNARAVLRPMASGPQTDPAHARGYVADDKRVGAGVSVAF